MRCETLPVPLRKKHSTRCIFTFEPYPLLSGRPEQHCEDSAKVVEVVHHSSQAIHKHHSLQIQYLLRFARQSGSRFKHLFRTPTLDFHRTSQPTCLLFFGNILWPFASSLSLFQRRYLNRYSCQVAECTIYHVGFLRRLLNPVISFTFPRSGVYPSTSRLLLVGKMLLKGGCWARRKSPRCKRR
jgi:hypothetical protein